MDISNGLQRSARRSGEAIREFGRNVFVVSKGDASFGVRMVIIALFPLLVAQLIHQPALGVMAYLGGLNTGSADIGGTYQRRALTMSLSAAGIVLVGFLATIVGTDPVPAILTMLLIAFLGSMLNVFGSVGTKIGFVTVACFIIILGIPGDISVVLPRCIAIFLGAAWALLVTLWAWPLRPDQPVRDAVAEYYRALHTFFHTMGSEVNSDERNELRWEEHILQARTHVQDVRNAAHATVISARSAQPGSSALFPLFFGLLFKADSLFTSIIALIESVETAPEYVRLHQIRQLLNTSVEQLADQLVFIANAITRDQNQIDTTHLNQVMDEITAQTNGIQTMQIDKEIDYVAFSHTRHILRLLNSLYSTIQSVVDMIKEPDSKRPSIEYEEASFQPVQRNWRDAVELMKDNFTTHSLIFRHALRLSITTTVGVAIYTILHIPHGYWLPFTALIVLKPDFQSTRQRGIQRVSGTIVGGIAAAALATFVYNALVLYLILAVLCYLAYSHMWRNYGIFVLFLTPLVILVIGLIQPGNWVVALVRMGNTIAGGALAFIAIYLFLPQWENVRLTTQLVATLAKNRVFFHNVMAVYLGETYHAETIRIASQEAHVECINAAVSLQRLLSEPKAKRGNVEKFYALVMYNQHICDNITVLSTQMPLLHEKYIPPGLQRYVKQMEEAMKRIEDALHTGKKPGRLPLLRESLHEMSAALSTRINLRVAELAAHEMDTANRKILRVYTPVGRQLDRLVQDMEGMYQAMGE
ncbi:MAG TPA: FUSC family protein [Ktedonobacteraceae bacterium]|nr:FUSC family protein [Ktedonobacteraceae bacterium]